jgi:hypothetical protein
MLQWATETGGGGTKNPYRILVGNILESSHLAEGRGGKVLKRVLSKYIFENINWIELARIVSW